MASAAIRLSETTVPAVVQPGAVRPVRSALTTAPSQSRQALAASRSRLARHRRQPAAAVAVAVAAVAKPGTGQPLPPSDTLPIANQPTIQPTATTATASPAKSQESRLSQRTALAPLPARPVAVQLAAAPGLPAPQPVAVVLSPLPLPFASRWAVQVVAGPALTYRSLNQVAGAGAGVSTSTSSPIFYNPANSTTAPVATLERPALGNAAQVTVRRTLGGHWSLSAGLGYAEYASALALQQVHTSNTRILAIYLDSSSTTGIHRRDTYRFATVPVRVGYGWTLSGRWRVGLLAGAEATVYVGGSSTEGSSCACQSQTWGFSGSPYRRLSLGASMGAEVRYRLGADGRWELLAQPTATYLLTPLAPASSVYYQRHLFGAAALLGVSFNLP